MGEILSGTLVAQSIRDELKGEVSTFKTEHNRAPGLAVILVGEDPGSISYVKGKMKACEEVGMFSKTIKLDEDVTKEEVLHHIHQLNQDPQIDGFLIQLPLPKHLNERELLVEINPEKDVDGAHPITLGKLMAGEDTYYPCTPFGIIKMLEFANVEIEGKHVVVIGRSNIVGKPMVHLLLKHNATVTICHSKTKDLREVAKQADILIVAIGRAHFVDETFVKPGAVVIDVGVNRIETGKLVGDVNTERVLDVASIVTPVPKGVGPMTITMLLYNTVLSAKRSASKELSNWKA